MSHSPEPWRDGLRHESMIRIEDASGRGIGTLTGSNLLAPREPSYDEMDANASRIIACVNALAGIPTEELKRPENVWGWASVAMETLNVLREFYGAGGLESLPAGTTVIPQITCSIQSRHLFIGERVDPDSYSNLSAALRVCHRNGYKIDRDAMAIISPDAPK
jgi:hypothetical protein